MRSVLENVVKQRFVEVPSCFAVLMLLGCEEELDRIISTGRNDSTEKALSAPETIQKNSFLVMNYWYRY